MVCNTGLFDLLALGSSGPTQGLPQRWHEKLGIRLFLLHIERKQLRFL